MSGPLVKSSAVFANASTLATTLRTGQFGEYTPIVLNALGETIHKTRASTQKALATAIAVYNRAGTQAARDSLLRDIADILEQDATKGLNAIIKQTGTRLSLKGTKRFADPEAFRAHLARTVSIDNPLSLIPVRFQQPDNAADYLRLVKEAERDYRVAISKKLSTGQQWRLAGRLAGEIYHGEGDRFRYVMIRNPMALKGRVVAGLYISWEQGVRIFAGTVGKVREAPPNNGQYYYAFIRSSGGSMLRISLDPLNHDLLRQLHYLDPQ